MSNNKPLCLRIEEAKKEISEVINRQRSENGIPFYILELIVKDLYMQVENGKNAEIMVIAKDHLNIKKGADEDGLGTREEIN